MGAAKRLIFFLRLCVIAVILLLAISCSTPPKDVRTAMPGDALVYLETKDLGKALTAITGSDAFKSASKQRPDVSVLSGVSVAVAVTGFETKEEKVTEENSVLSFQPRFVAIAETNAWNYQAIKFAENKLGEFVNEIYGGGVELQRFPKYNGDFFVWTNEDGRKAYALVIGSLIYFANDESGIEKCVAVRNGEAESFAKGGKLAANKGDLATGYVSPDGVAQLANIGSIQLAVGAGEEEEVRAFIARVLPEILRNSVKEIRWNATSESGGRMADSYSITLAPDVASVFNETLVRGADADPDLSRFVPDAPFSTTRYDLKDAQIAWRSLLFTARSRTDETSGSLLSIASSSLFDPYGVEDQEMFLSSISGVIQTVRFDAEGEEVAAIARIKDIEKLKRSLSKELKIAGPPEQFEGADIWRSDDGEAVAFVENHIIVGERSAVERCLTARNAGRNLASTLHIAQVFGSSKAPIVTAGLDADTAQKLVEVLTGVKSEAPISPQPYTIETTFNKDGIERRTVSGFGIIGSIIEQFAKEQ